MSKSLKEIQDRLEQIKTEYEENNSKIVALEAKKGKLLNEMENLSSLVEKAEEDVKLSDLAEIESIWFKFNNLKEKFMLESYREFNNPGWVAEIEFTNAIDAYNFLNSVMFERLFENGYAEKYRVIRGCDNKIVYSKELEHASD